MTTPEQANRMAMAVEDTLWEKEFKVGVARAIIDGIPLVELLDAAKAAHRMIEAEKLDVTRGNLCQLAAHLEALKEKGVSLE